MLFKKNEANPKPNKLWADEFSKLYNRSMKPWLHEMYSTLLTKENLLQLKNLLES